MVPGFSSSSPWPRRGAAFLLGVVLWYGWTQLTPPAGPFVRFVLTSALFVFGPGVAIATWIAPETDAIERAALAAGLGLTSTLALAQLLFTAHLAALYPLAAALLAGAAVVSPRRGRHSAPRVAAADLRACGLAVAISIAGGAIAYAHRLDDATGVIQVRGDYDSFDSSFYAAISAELANQVPPDAAFEAGHRLGYAYYSQLLPAMIHRFGGVSLLDLYFRYAWPAYLGLAALAIFGVVRSLAGRRVALLATVLMLFGSDLSYIAAFVRPREAEWDRLIWSTNWLTPGAEQLFFNTWTPTLAVMMAGVWLFDRHTREGGWRSLAGAAFVFASLLQLKPFAFALVAAGLAGTTLMNIARPVERRRMLAVSFATLVCSVPFLIAIRSVYKESQAVLQIGNGYVSVLPAILIPQLGLGPALSAFGERNPWAAPAVAVAGSVSLLLVGGVGARWLGARELWRHLAHRSAAPGWNLVAWQAAAGWIFPLAFITHPYHQTFHTLQGSLYLSWIFAAHAALARQRVWTRALCLAALLLTAVPSTVHYLRVKWDDQPFASIDQDAQQVATVLAHESRAETVFLQRYHQGPSFLSVLSERRTVLAWSRYVRESLALQQEVDDFFRSADGRAADAVQTLRRHHVTHVVESVARDRIHPDVLRRLTLLVDTPNLRLYSVPPDVTSGPATQVEIASH